MNRGLLDAEIEPLSNIREDNKTLARIEAQTNYQTVKIF